MFRCSREESPIQGVIQFRASPRELLNLFQAETVGCHIITATNDILKKLALIGKDLKEYSLETVKMFYEDARHAGYKLETTRSTAKIT
jgi:transaldolase